MWVTLRKRAREVEPRDLTQEHRDSRAVNMVLAAQFLNGEYNSKAAAAKAHLLLSNRDFTPDDVNSLSRKISYQVDKFQEAGEGSFRLYLLGGQEADAPKSQEVNGRGIC